jgi:hypothetical protein
MHILPSLKVPQIHGQVRIDIELVAAQMRGAAAAKRRQDEYVVRPGHAGLEAHGGYNLEDLSVGQIANVQLSHSVHSEAGDGG